VIRLPSAADPAVSLIVLLDGAAELGERCLRAIAAGDDAIPHETVILLNDPSPELERLVRAGTAGARVVVSRANAGPGVGWNLGAAVAKAPRLATMHEDSEPSEGWLAPLVEAMTETGAGAVGSRLYDDDGSVQNCGWVLFSDANHQPITPAVAPEVVDATEPTPADTLSGAAMLVDREAVRTAGGWDERFHPAIFMDIDISTAIWSQGRPVLSVPASGVRHSSGTFDHRPDSALTGRQLRLFLFERHRDDFIAKWGDAVRGLSAAPADRSPENVKSAVQAALGQTRERLKRVRGEGPRERSAGRAELRFTGIAEPVRSDGSGAYRVAAEVEDALGAAEVVLVDEYCRMMVRREAEIAAYLGEATEVLDQRRREVAELQAQVAALRRGHDELAAQLDAVLGSRAWRLRNLLVRALRRAPPTARTRDR
jgi:GT2 family glycosyltransferase